MSLLDPNSALAQLPPSLRGELLATYSGIIRNFAQGRWEPAELNGGKFAEVVVSIIEGALQGRYPQHASKPKNFAEACRALERVAADPDRVGDRSLRVLIPRTLLALYEVRNNRGVGHVGGDVDPNHMDALLVTQAATWTMAELVRIFHGLSPQQAQECVDLLVDRPHPIIWHHDGVKRVLDPTLNKSDQALILLHSAAGWTRVTTLVQWIEYSNASVFRMKVLGPLHASRVLEYRAELDDVMLTPVGVRDVEERLLPRYA